MGRANGIAVWFSNHGTCAPGSGNIVIARYCLTNGAPSRMNGASLFLASGLGALGALVAGLFGQSIGLGTTLIIAVIGIQGGTLILLISPLRGFRDLPLPLQGDP